MHDEEYTLEESVEDLPTSPMPLRTRNPRNASFAALLPKVLSDQWVAFSIVCLLLPVTLLFFDLILGIDIMAEDAKSDGSGGRNDDSTFFVVAMLVVWTIAFVLIFRSRFQLIRRLHIHGVQVPCQVLNSGIYVRDGMIDVTLQYQYGGKVYRPRRSVLVEDVKHINQVRIDPENPIEYWVDN